MTTEMDELIGTPTPSDAPRSGGEQVPGNPDRDKIMLDTWKEAYSYREVKKGAQSVGVLGVGKKHFYGQKNYKVQCKDGSS
ncbi:hypothetical protein ACH4KN_32875 [Streptomyces sp. NPDC017546]|uniref:hypothetical protein n=1 Tax=Streptomyces sp. NPDC017546 TaxID=3365001 RepID=UPI0037A212BB